MTYTEMKEVFSQELSFLEGITEYEQGLERLNNVGEAETDIEAWQEDGYDDFPASFTRKDGPQILMLLWNTFIVPDEETAEKVKREAYDEQVKKDYPDWLAFDHYYADGSCLFIAPDSIDLMLRQHNYDEAHRDLIIKALKAYHKTYMENL